MFTSMVQATWEVILVYVFPLHCLWAALTDCCSAPVFGLVNGGLAGLFWSYVWTFFGFCAIVLSLAEMSSMYAQSVSSWRASQFSNASVTGLPRMADNTTGRSLWPLTSSQFSPYLLTDPRVSEFSPRRYQKFLSYMSGEFRPLQLTSSP
jgi:hypothetical protein